MKWKKIALHGVVILVTLFAVGVAAFPLFASARMGGKDACLNNVKNLGMSLLMYASDNDGQLPNRDEWMDATHAYIDQDSYYRCPDLIRPEESDCYGYAFNSILSNAKPPKDADIVWLVYDSINLARNASDPGLSLPKKPRGTRRANHICYADGHAKSLREVKP